MKHIKEYKEIDLDDWDFEEEDPNIGIKFKIGDKIRSKNSHILFYDSNEKIFKSYRRDSHLTISDIKHAKNITSDNNIGSIKIKYDDYLFTAEGLWPWIKFDNIIKI